MNKKAKISLVVFGFLAVITLALGAVYFSGIVEAEGEPGGGVPVPQPDYTSDLTPVGGAWHPYDPVVSYAVTTRNIGNANAESWSVTKVFIKRWLCYGFLNNGEEGYECRSGWVTDGWTRTDYYNVPALISGALHQNTGTLICDGAVPAPDWALVKYEMWSGADHLNQISESNENNNHDYEYIVCADLN